MGGIRRINGFFLFDQSRQISPPASLGTPFREALEACALEADLAIIPGGDMAYVGERGATLSGGQRLRVSLARCGSPLSHSVTLERGPREILGEFDIFFCVRKLWSVVLVFYRILSWLKATWKPCI